MFGGMMMKFCGLAHRLPITLKHGQDAEGILLHQDECRIEYSSYEELIEDVDKLLTDDAYRKAREELLDGSVITEERFKNNIRGVIENHKTDYEHAYEEVDTRAFRKEYFERFNYNEEMLGLARKNNRCLLAEFPFTFIKGVVGSRRKVCKKIKEKIRAKL